MRDEYDREYDRRMAVAPWIWIAFWVLLGVLAGLGFDVGIATW